MDMEMTFPGGKAVDALFEGRRIRTDQPKSSGGEGSAPAPFDLFLASIGTCTAYYVLAFCRTRNIPLDDVRVGMDIEPDEERKRIGCVRVVIRLPASFPDKYRKAVVKAAKFCAVTKYILDPFEIAVEESSPETS